MNNLAELMNMAHAGDKWARDRLVADNLGLVYAVVRRFEHRGHDREELFQIGCIGLMKAVDHFDVSLQLAFSTYAVPMITGEIRRFLRDDGMVKVSRTLKEQGYRISRARETLVSILGREPDMAELSAATELSTEEIAMALEANREVESIYRPVYEKDGDELLMIDQVENGSNAAYTGEEPEKEDVLNSSCILYRLFLYLLYMSYDISRRSRNNIRFSIRLTCTWLMPSTAATSLCVLLSK